MGWVRRSRAGYPWLDEIDVPLGESAERYRVRILGTAGTIERDVSAPIASFSSIELAPAGSGPATISVAQVGDRALSRWTSLSITFA